MEPNGSRSAEANENIQHILEGGALKAEPGIKLPRLDAGNMALNKTIIQAVALVSKRRYIRASDQFASQLQSIFAAIGKVALTQGKKDFFQSVLADRFYKLSQTSYTDTFSHVIRQGINPADAAWVKAHPEQITALNNWFYGK